MNVNKTYKLILSEVRKLPCLYLIVPITSSTCERTFSVLKRLLTYLRSTMTEKQLKLFRAYSGYIHHETFTMMSLPAMSL